MAAGAGAAPLATSEVEDPAAVEDDARTAAVAVRETDESDLDARSGQ